MKNRYIPARDAGLLLAVCALFLGAGAGEACLDRAEAAQDVPLATVEAVPVETVQAVPVGAGITRPLCQEAEPWSIDMEDPEEDEKITAALEAQGYFRPEVPLDYELQDNLHSACEQYGVPYELSLGLIQVESNFDPEADNGGCYGLCQLSRRYFPGDLSPAENIWAGMEYLGYQLGRYDTLEAALEGYHAGHDTGDRAYARKVMAYAEEWGWRA